MSYYFARVKPYNPKRGHVVRRIHCMGTLWEGGSGVPPDTIPSWTKVNAAQAEVLKRFKQRDNDPYSGSVFDIVTPEMRKDIDIKEEQYRKSLMGVASNRAIGELPDMAARTINAAGTGSQPLRSDGSRMTLQDLMDTKVTTLDVDSLADDYDIGGLDGHLETRAAALAKVQADEKDLTGGRAEAVAELDGTPDAMTEASETSEETPKPAKRRGRRKSK